MTVPNGRRATHPGTTSPQPAYRLRLLGGFELTHDGSAVHVPTSSRRVLAFLALQTQSRDRGWIAGQLWTDSPEERAYANLRSALWRIRRLGNGLVRRVGPQLKLTSGVELDIVRFETSARRGLPEIASDPRAAVGLFTSELLPDWTEDWVLGERERLRQVGLHALEALALDLVTAGRGADAVEVALAAVQMEPSRESAQRALIAAHAAQGNYPDALRQYDRYCAYLREELGLTPSPQLHGLIRELVEPRREAAA